MAVNLLTFLILILFGFAAFGEATVKSIPSASQLIVDIKGGEGFNEGERVVILSKEKKQIAAVGKITDIHLADRPGQIKARIQEIVDDFMVMPGDQVELLDFKLYQDKKIPGFFALTLNGNQKVPSQYKELAYFGVFTSEGHTLDKKEMMVSPFQFQYGLTNDFSVRVVNALWLDGYANVGAKYRLLKNKKAKITFNSLGAYKVQSQDWIGQAGGVVTIPSNSKFQSHFMLNVVFDPQFEQAKATKDLRLFKDSDIRNITEYITDNWNRVLYGPVYNVELQTFGGTISHMWIWDTFHMSLGLATRNLSNLTFSPKGYYYVYDLFWRF